MTWERRRYRGSKAWIEVGEDGRPTLDPRGLASLRYRKDDPRTYTVRPEEVRTLEGPEPPAAPPEDVIDVFAGSASPAGPAGIGAVLVWKGRRREISRSLGRATRRAAELTAVLEALRAIRRPDHPVRVHVGSDLVPDALAEGRASGADGELVAGLRGEMARFPRVDIERVPSLTGVPEGRRAEALAREGAGSAGP
jgi:ribonuclease HI